MRKNIVAGNWKMNLNRSEGLGLVEDVLSKLPVDNKTHVILAPSFVYLHKVAKMCTDIPKVVAASQDCSANEKGAFTGEVSASMIASCSARYVVLGHSERRTNFTETNELLKTKVGQVFANDLKVIFCCGESLAQRENGVHFDWIKSQISESLFHLSVEEFKNIVIAYEPIWAIGTGVTASTDQAQVVHAFIRNLLVEKYGNEVAENTSILYGGSCQPNNAIELFSQKDIDGGLIGGASLNAADFVAITQSF
ncbi:MAG: triose-phosphate isomerase [Flavobacteriales bacterium]|nr:triose-phosphate isomerase [Flavobacteriales bacterium]